MAAGRVRRLTFGLTLVAVLFAMLAGSAQAASRRLLSRRVRSAERLQGVGTSTNAPRAFVKGNTVRLFYRRDAKAEVFQAGWRRPLLEGRDYACAAAELRFDTHSPRLPSPDSSWREAVVLQHESWDALARDTALSLVTGTNSGTYFQLVNLEGILYRDRRGNLVETRVEDKPADVAIARRANAEEFSVALARRLAANVALAHPGQRLFFINPLLDDEHPEFLLVDLSRRLCVYLSAPMPPDDPRGAPRLLPSLRMYASFLFESHGLALVKNPVSAAGRLLNVAFHAATGWIPVRLSPTREVPPPLGSGPGMDLTQWERWLDRATSSRRLPGQFRLLINGEEFFPEFERRLAQARRSIDLRVCIFDRDDVAVDVADRLRQKSKDVEVRVLVDRLATLASGQIPPATAMRPGFVPPSTITGYLEHDSKVRVRPFLNPWFSSDHDKVFLIDGEIAYLGGMNLGREYRYEWHDLMFELRGPIVEGFARDFSAAWAHAGLLGDLAYAARAAVPPRPPPPWRPDPRWAYLRPLYTRTGNAEIQIAILAALRRARREIFLENAYLFDKAVVQALVEARLRGVDVRVVIPNNSDIGGSNSNNFVTANRLIDRGVRVYIYPGMTHVKALLVDGWTCLGSANFNNLSLLLNQETNIATSDARIAGEVRQRLFETDFAKSHELKHPLAVNWTDHLAERVLSQF